MADPDIPSAALRRLNSSEILAAYQAMPDPVGEVLAQATHILSEWLNDNAPIGEGRYREPARALLKFSTFAAHLSTDRHLQDLDTLLKLVEDEADDPDFPDEEAVGYTGDGNDLPMTFGHIRRARRALTALRTLLPPPPATTEAGDG